MNRKEAIAEYKNRKVPRGMFVVRFADDGPAFVDATPDLDAARNSLLFTLRNSLHPNKELQAEWNAHSEEAFEYQILEMLDEDVNPHAIQDLLKEQKVQWAERLGARTLL